MKPLYRYIIVSALSCFFAMPFSSIAQDSASVTTVLSLRYYVINNNIQYLIAETNIKKGKKTWPIPHQHITVYMDSVVAKNLLSDTITNEKGLAKIAIRPTFKDQWLGSNKHSFIAVIKKNGVEDISTTLDIARARIVMDTSTVDTVHTITAKVLSLENGQWQPAADVELKLGIVRSAGLLSAGDELVYTTDSTGIATVDLNKLNLPGDAKGNIILIAKIEDNELYGNLLMQENVPWGIAVKKNNNFFSQRTLWSTQSRTPFWLLFMAYSIAGVVWGTICYLIWQLVRIKKMASLPL